MKRKVKDLRETKKPTLLQTHTGITADDKGVVWTSWIRSISNLRVGKQPSLS